jgi:uncharacterized membrane protein
METHRKSLLKAVSWRIVGSIDTFVISWLVTGSAKIGLGISAVEVVTKIVLFYVHERAWSRVK